MRLTIFLLTTAFLHAHATGKAQNITLTGQNLTLKEVFRVIEKQANYLVLGNKDLMAKSKPVTVSVKQMPVRDFLDLVFRDQAIGYIIKGNNIILSRIEKTEAPKPLPLVLFNDGPPPVKLRVKVVDSTGLPLAGATVSVKGKKKTTVTSAAGIASIDAEEGDMIEVSYIGYQTFLYKVSGSDETRNIEVQLKPGNKAMTEVVISSGFVNRRAESFTGSALTVTREELLRNGNQNILQSLKNIDPSFRITENLEMGSNPNMMPEIVLRGKSSMPDLTGTFSGNPNEPLFILDGFEAPLQRIYDLDMNRVKSVTILKDATAKAIYGAKAGNGVVVVETMQPAAGKLRVSYTGNLNVEAPDLTGYNLMNAKEKLQWEKDHDMWRAGPSDTYNFRQDVYNSLYQDVYEKGVNTYWLSKPLRTGIGQRHSVNLEGGDAYMRYGASFMYNNIEGAMKGSNRNTFSANTNLSYRTRNLFFRNTIEFTQNKANNSPYGSFQNYVNLNPYWSPFDAEGKLNPVVGFYPEGVVPQAWTLSYNPLYNASLNNKDENKYVQVSDNFQMEWRIDNRWRFNGGFGYMYQRNGADVFLPPGNTSFLNYTEANGLINYKGRWTKSDGMQQTMETNLGLSYTYNVGKHLLIGNVTFNLSDIYSRSNTVIAEGFGSDNVWDISMGTYYQRGGAPTGTESRSRTVGAVGMLNYSWENRFIFDANYRTSASSQYGANSRWGNFWSLGAGWNLHSEKLFQDLGFSQFRVRGSMGYTGAQNANIFSTQATNQYSQVVYDGMKGTQLAALPNPNLGWQKNMDYNLGVDIAVLNNKISLRGELYKKITTNLVTSISSPPSFGFATYMANLGSTENTGYELSLRYQALSIPKRKAFVNLSVGVTHNRNRLVDISDAFAAYNKDEDKAVTDNNRLYTKPVARYYEGQSLDAIWAMKSLGIDPATGNEMFLDRNGKITDVWMATDLIIAGDAQPKVNGNFGINAGYMGWNLALTCTFRYGGQLYNGTLVERVENINGRNNLDKRILEAWHNVGDIAIYKRPQVSSAINSITYTRPTTRFVQDNNELYVSTINLSYEVQSQRFLKRLGLERLRTTFYTNELLRVSSITVERGTTYPFSRNFSFTVNASF